MSSSKMTLRRIRADIRELSIDPSSSYHAVPLEDDMFVWHFTIKGPQDTEFEGGVYHGLILLPPTYPLSPPNIMFTSPSGRFETNTKICLSISAYHPEHWQPAWGIRLILEAIRSFMTTPGEGAIGAIDCSKEERRRLAKDSHKYRCAVCGPIASLIPEGGKEDGGAKFKDEIKQLHMHTPVASPAGKDEDKDEDKGKDEDEDEDKDKDEDEDKDEDKEEDSKPACPPAREEDKDGDSVPNSDGAARLEPDAAAGSPPPPTPVLRRRYPTTNSSEEAYKLHPNITPPNNAPPKPVVPPFWDLWDPFVQAMTLLYTLFIALIYSAWLDYKEDLRVLEEKGEVKLFFWPWP
mmetsp:Transcript_22990/g.45870  ORF Transcript_22990/g.45870 Transcript_22990/m.45870 type:complete len:349 (+) Transcript_22990:246-1292(+)